MLTLTSTHSDWTPALMKKKAPTIKEIAKLANVSPMTVSRAVNNSHKVREETRENILEIADRLGYRPNRIARSLVSKKSNLISLVVANISNPFFAEISRGIEDKARENGYNVIFSSTDDDTKNLESCVQTMREVGVDGFIIAAVCLKEPIVDKLVDQEFPVVLINRRVKKNNVNYVVVDNQKGAFLAVEHLINNGYKKIGIIAGKSSVSTGKERFQSYRQTLLDHGIKFKKEYSSQGPFTKEHGKKAAQKMLTLKNRPEAIFAASDNIALGVMDAAGELGLNIPEDLAIVGFDDTDFSSNSKIRLTTVSQRKYEMGERGVQILIDLIERQQPDYISKIVLEPRLIIRESCGRNLSKKKIV
jgi:LacI family transcriptional regulator